MSNRVGSKGAADGEWHVGFVWTAGCQDLRYSASHIWKSVKRPEDAGARIETQISFTWAPTLSQRPKRPNVCHRAAVVMSGTTLFFPPHFRFLLPVQTHRLWADCRSAAVEEELRRLTCLRSTFICFKKNKSDVDFPKPQKTPGDCSRLRATFIMSFHRLKSQLRLFGLRGHSASFIASALFYISIWPWIPISCWSPCCSLSHQVANVYDFGQSGLLLFFHRLGDFKWSVLCLQELPGI